jgi:excisionase family DNA binding protein
MAKKYLTPTEVADLLMVAPVTVRQWAQKGLIEARTTAGGHRRFTMEAVRAFASEMGMELAGLDTGLDRSRILVVDDDRQFNGFLVALFQQQFPELNVDVAYDGFDAGRQIQRVHPYLVLLDIMMPGLDGVEVCKRLKAEPETAAIRVIAMTGHHTPELEQRILAAGAERLLKKPFSTAELVAACGLSGQEAD